MDDQAILVPETLYDRQDWVRACLTKDGDFDCDKEISETLDDLHGTVQLMFDKETERRVREVERLSQNYSEATHTPSKRSRKAYRREQVTQYLSDSSDSNYGDDSDEPALKPMPLFSERRAITHPGAHPPQRMTSSSDSPRSMSSSFVMSASTSATSVSPTEPLLAVKLAAAAEQLDPTFTLPPPIPPPRHPARLTDPDRSLFPPRRSSLHAKSLIATPTPQNSPTTENFPKRTSSLFAPNDFYHVHLRNSKHESELKQGRSDTSLERAKSMAVLSTTPPRVKPQRPNTGTGTEAKTRPTISAPYMKMWTPPTYNPTPFQPIATPATPTRRKHDMRKRDSFRKTLLALHKSASVSSLSLASKRDNASPIINSSKDFDFTFKTPSKPVKHDSLSPFATTPTTSNFRARSPQHLRLVIPEANGVQDYPILGPVPSPARSDQLMLEIEDGLRALQCESTFATPRAAPQPSPSPKRSTFVRGDSIRRMASSAHKRLSFNFSGTKEVDRPDTTRSSFHSDISSPSWVTVPSFASQPHMSYTFESDTSDPYMHKPYEPEEIVVDPNNLLSGGGPVRSFDPNIQPKSVWSTYSEASDITTTNTSSSFLASTFSIPPLRTKRSRRELEFQAHPYEGMTAVTTRNSRMGLDGGRNMKANKVLGLFEGAVGKHAEKTDGKKPPKKKQRKEKSRSRDRSEGRGKWDGVFEVMSKAFELG